MVLHTLRRNRCGTQEAYTTTTICPNPPRTPRTITQQGPLPPSTCIRNSPFSWYPFCHHGPATGRREWCERHMIIRDRIQSYFPEHTTDRFLLPNYIAHMVHPTAGSARRLCLAAPQHLDPHHHACPSPPVCHGTLRLSNGWHAYHRATGRGWILACAIVLAVGLGHSTIGGHNQSRSLSHFEGLTKGH